MNDNSALTAPTEPDLKAIVIAQGQLALGLTQSLSVLLDRLISLETQMLILSARFDVRDGKCPQPDRR